MGNKIKKGIIFAGALVFAFAFFITAHKASATYCTYDTECPDNQKCVSNACTGNGSPDCLSKPGGQCILSNDSCSAISLKDDSSGSCETGKKCCSSDGGGGLTGKGIEIPDNTGLPDPAGGIKAILTNVLTWLLGIFGIVALVAFVISGIIYLISTGDEKMVEKAKAAMTWAIVGVIVALSGFVIIKAIQAILTATPNSPI